MGDRSNGQTSAWLPSRAIVELPSLAVVAVEPDPAPVAASNRVVGASVLELFDPAVAEVITRSIAPAVLRGEVWSGELVLDTDPAEPTTAMTLWVPHERPSGVPEAATVLIGASIPSTGVRVAPDPDTGLPTRVVLLDRLDLAQRRSRRNGDLMAALFVDLDGLKTINDRHGHEEGDAAIRRAAERIRSCMRDGDTVARFGGDEFVVLCESLDDESQARRVAERILDRLRSGGQNALSASIGVAFDHAGGLSALELIGRADAAMYRAKSRGGSRFEVFDQEMQGRIAADEALRHRLIEALEGPGLDVAAQPLFELATGRVLGVELLVRLQAGDAQVVEGDDLRRLARGYTEAVDTAVLGRAIAIARNWHQRFGRRCPRLHLRVSPPSLGSNEFAGRVAAGTLRHRVDPRLFAFEVDGHDLVPDDARGLATLDRLREMGSGVVLSGFGDGGPSLALVDRLSPTMVKIPAGDGGPNPLSHGVIAAAIRAASGLGAAGCVAGIAGQTLLEHVVTAGAYAAQGGALAPVGSIESAQQQLSRRPTLGY